MTSLHRRSVAPALLAAALLAGACASSDDENGDGAANAPTTTTADAPAELIAFPDPEWTTVDPVDAGFDPDLLDEAVASAEASGSHCLAVTRNGQLVGEWNFGDWTSDDTTLFFSATKSMASTVVGIAQDEGLLDIDDRASDYIPEWQGTDSDEVTIRDLLSNDSGRFWSFDTDYQQMPGEPDNTAFALSLDQQFPPDQHWEYNNAAIQSLEAVLEGALDEDPVDFAQSRFVEPLGFDGQWRTDGSGNLLTYMGFDGTCSDSLRFGNLALAGGEWDGERVVSEQWLAEATGQPSQELNAGYGFLWWRNTEGGWLDVATGDENDDLMWEDVPADAYAALGLGGQMSAVHPSTGVVIARLAPAGALGTNAAPVELQHLVHAALTDP